MSDSARSARPDPIDAEGGCACGKVRYRVKGRPRIPSLCHCADCRKSSGATPVGWVAFRRTEVTWVTEPPKDRASSERAVRSFCPDCGAQIMFRYHAHPDYVDLTIGSLDDPGLVAPQAHIWMKSKVAWVHLDEDLRRYEEDLPV